MRKCLRLQSQSFLLKWKQSQSHLQSAFGGSLFVLELVGCTFEASSVKSTDPDVVLASVGAYIGAWVGGGSLVLDGWRGLISDCS